MKKISATDTLARSADLVGDHVEQLRSLFPNAFTEGKVDFDVLRQMLGDSIDEREEKYGLHWHGKREARQVALTASTGTLLPNRSDSVEWDTTKNVFIEGENLEVLKLLQKGTQGKVKLIYIDPPYNTGNEFIYPDNFRDPLQEYLRYSSQLDAQGARWSTNTETNGRFHSRWLDMMWPRLFLARHLLSEDGVIAVSIDDNEMHNLRHLLDEIFGAENFVAVFAWQKRDTPANDAKGVSVTHEYVVMYRRSELFFRKLLPRSEDQLANYKNPDNDPRGPWTRTSLIRKEVRENRCYSVNNPAGRPRVPPAGTSWRIPPETFALYTSENRVWWGQDSDGDLPFLKRFLTEVQDGVVPITWWDYEFAGSNRNGKMEIRDLFDGEVPFETPKPALLVKRLLDIVTDPEDLILDFFAGSGTTADAVMSKNAEDGGTRRFLLVQLPEPIGGGPHKTLADVCKDRIRRAGHKRRAAFRSQRDGAGTAGTAEAGQDIDVGFRVFTLAPSNVKRWNPQPEEELSSLLGRVSDNILPGRSEEDLLFELVLKLGLDLTTSIESKKIAGKTVHAIGAGVLLACLAPRLDKGDIEPLGLGIIAWHQAMKPSSESTVMFRDNAFSDDVAKTNLTALLEQAGIRNVRSL